jgi:hypothetical protein
MADLLRWFKVWTTILDDPTLQELPLEQIGRWVLLGAMTASVGSHGRLVVAGSGRRICELLRVPTIEAAKDVISDLPNVVFEEGKNRHGEFVVTWKNWTKFQRDSTQAQRAKASRSKRRGEERREEENILRTPPPAADDVVGTNSHAAKAGAVAASATLTPDKLMQLLNELMPREFPGITKLTDARRKKLQAALRQLPDREAWQRIAAEVTASPFLRGLRPSPGHEHFRCDVDWLLGKSKTGSENYVRVLEGHYRDRRDQTSEEDE